jgi:hypothetical protein
VTSKPPEGEVDAAAVEENDEAETADTEVLVAVRVGVEALITAMKALVTLVFVLVAELPAWNCCASFEGTMCRVLLFTSPLAGGAWEGSERDTNPSPLLALFADISTVVEIGTATPNILVKFPLVLV